MKARIISLVAILMAMFVGATAQNTNTTVNKTVTNETQVVNTSTNQVEYVDLAATYDINTKVYGIINLWKDSKGESQPIWIKEHSKYGSYKSGTDKRLSNSGIAAPKMLSPGASFFPKVGTIDTLLAEVGGEKVARRYICFAISVGNDKEFRDIEIPYTAKVIAIVSNSAEGEKFLTNEALIAGGKKTKSYKVYLPNNFVVDNDNNLYFNLENTSKYQISINDESFTTNALPSGESVQITNKDASKLNVKKGIWTVSVSFKDPTNNDPPTVKTLYLPIPKNGGSITVNDNCFSNVTKNDAAGNAVVVQYILRNPSPFAIQVSGLKSKEKGVVADDIMVINPGASKVILVGYGSNSITITANDQTGAEINTTIKLIADWRSSGRVYYNAAGKEFRLIPN